MWVLPQLECDVRINTIRSNDHDETYWELWEEVTWVYEFNQLDKYKAYTEVYSMALASLWYLKMSSFKYTLWKYIPRTQIQSTYQKQNKIKQNRTLGYQRKFTEYIIITIITVIYVRFLFLWLFVCFKDKIL